MLATLRRLEISGKFQSNAGPQIPPNIYPDREPPHMSATITLPIVDGVRIVVPDSLDLITPYVLQEQQDWFEDEIKFLRHLLRPGQKVIDIGANYGVYTLSMAHTVGVHGKIWAFEPASTTAALLAASIAANGYTQVTLDQSAVSSACGTAQLSLNDNSELNALVHGHSAQSTSETVPLVTLDSSMQRYGWESIDFLKIDAEGEEANILKGGTRFFAELSPLVQYEIKVEGEADLRLVRYFSELGYSSYRLVPGLNVLMPFDSTATPDSYLLNLFCCKPDRAQQLAAQGFLVNTPTASDLDAAAQRLPAYDWRQSLVLHPYAMRLAREWNLTTAADPCAELMEALSWYLMSQDSAVPMTERFIALETSFQQLQRLCSEQAVHLRLASLARVACAYGARAVAVAALGQQCNTIFQNQRVDLSEPFLAPWARFDAIEPGNSPGNWVLAAAMEGFETLAAFSSFYVGLAARNRLQPILQLGFHSPEMTRRLELVQRRFHLSSVA